MLSEDKNDFYETISSHIAKKLHGGFMGKLGVFENVSVDGYFAGPNGEIDWFIGDEETAQYAKDQCKFNKYHSIWPRDV